MTWGEIQIISLQKMFANDEAISVDDLDDLREDDDCIIYLDSMPAVANEAIQRIRPYTMNLYKYNEDEEEYKKVELQKIDKNTSDDTVINLPDDACVLMPLYIASQLYKDDDISQATTYRNEFEVGLQDLYMNIENPTEIKEVF